MRENTDLFVFGSAGNNVTVNTAVATLPIAIPGRYKFWGAARHTLIDGLKITTPVAVQLCSAANDTAIWGPIVADITVAGNIIIALATATGASDTASANIFAELLNH